MYSIHLYLTCPLGASWSVSNGLFAWTFTNVGLPVEASDRRTRHSTVTFEPPVTPVFTSVFPF